MFKLQLCLITFLYVLSHSNLALSGGPLVLAGPSGNTPVAYGNPTVTLHTEKGGLGEGGTRPRTNDEATFILQAAFDKWNSVSTASINLKINRALLLNVEIDASNAASYISDYNDNINPVIYDNNGEYIDLFFGVGASSETLGFSGSAWYETSATFAEGFILINGKIVHTDTELLLVFAHEAGHFFGIDHSQVNINNQESDSAFPGLCTTTSNESYPLMYPFSCRATSSLHADDISAVSALYPTASVSSTYGTLQGRFLDEAGNAILGANIWVINTTTGESYSVVSDYLKQGTGFYKIFLPAGNYTLHANSINVLFTEGSSVGPYALSPFDASFRAPHPITAPFAPPVTYQDETGNDEIISITVNQIVNVNFAPNGKAAILPSEGGSGNGLFGTSPLMLIFLMSLLFIGRRLSK